jgi:hypothetical protein
MSFQESGAKGNQNEKKGVAIDYLTHALELSNLLELL